MTFVPYKASKEKNKVDQLYFSLPHGNIWVHLTNIVSLLGAVISCYGFLLSEILSSKIEQLLRSSGLSCRLFFLLTLKPFPFPPSHNFQVSPITLGITVLVNSCQRPNHARGGRMLGHYGAHSDAHEMTVVAHFAVRPFLLLRRCV